MARFIRFHRELFAESLAGFKNTWEGLAFWFGLVATGALGALSKRFGWAKAVTDWLSVSPRLLVWLGVVLFLVRLVYVNYRRFRQAADIEDLKEALAMLARLRAEGVQIYARVVGPEDLDGWFSAHRAWRDRVVDALRLHHRESTVLGFENLGVIAVAEFVQGIGRKHNHQLAMLTRRLEILQELIEEIRRSIPVGSLVSASISSASSSQSRA